MSKRRQTIPRSARRARRETAFRFMNMDLIRALAYMATPGRECCRVDNHLVHYRVSQDRLEVYHAILRQWEPVDEQWFGLSGFSVGWQVSINPIGGRQVRKEARKRRRKK